MSRADQRAETAALVRKARYGKQHLAVTKCLPGRWQLDSCIRFKGAHMLPGHLNPVTMV